MSKRFYLMVVQYENERKRWKMKDHFENVTKSMFLKKMQKTNKMGRSQTINKRNKKAECAHL